MKELLLTYRGRITRGQIWTALLAHFGIAVVTVVLFKVLMIAIPGSVDEDGDFSVEGVRALPFLALGLAYLAFGIWSGICVGIKRYHDRDKSGWWLLIQLVPVIGSVWYFVESFCLSGTPGPNRFGPDPLGRETASPLV